MVLDQFRPKRRASEAAEGFDKSIYDIQRATGSAVNAITGLIPGVNPHEKAEWAEFIKNPERQLSSPVRKIREQFKQRFKEVFFTEDAGGSPGWLGRRKQSENYYTNRFDSGFRALGNIALLPGEIALDAAESIKNVTTAATNFVTFPFGQTNYKLDADLSKFSFKPKKYKGLLRPVWETADNLLLRTVVGYSRDSHEDDLTGKMGLLGGVNAIWDGASETFLGAINLDVARIVRAANATTVNLGLATLNTTASFAQTVGQVATSVPYSVYDWASNKTIINEDNAPKKKRVRTFLNNQLQKRAEKKAAESNKVQPQEAQQPNQQPSSEDFNPGSLFA